MWELETVMKRENFQEKSVIDYNKWPGKKKRYKVWEINKKTGLRDMILEDNEI